MEWNEAEWRIIVLLPAELVGCRRRRTGFARISTRHSSLITRSFHILITTSLGVLERRRMEDQKNKRAEERKCFQAMKQMWVQGWKRNGPRKKEVTMLWTTTVLKAKPRIRSWEELMNRLTVMRFGFSIWNASNVNLTVLGELAESFILFFFTLL